MSNVAAFRLNRATNEPPTADLIARTIDGDGDAYAMLVERFQQRIQRITLAIVHNDVEADTITQDTFVQAYLHLASFQRRSEFETWLTRIAINRSRDFLRRRRFISLFTGEEGEDEQRFVLEPVDDRPDPERNLMAVQLRRAITNAERTLSAQQKVIFRLRHYENLPLEEIAEHLGLKSGTVRAHLFRAVQKIRRELSGWRQSNAASSHDPEVTI